MSLFSFDPADIVKILSLLKKVLFSVVFLYSLPGASFLLKRSVNNKTFSSMSKGSLKRFLRLWTLASNLSNRSLFFLTFISQSKSQTSWNYFPGFGSNACSSICWGEYSHFADHALFKLNVAFFINSFGLIRFPLNFPVRLFLNKVYCCKSFSTP